MRKGLIIATAMALTACNTAPVKRTPADVYVPTPCEVENIPKPVFLADEIDLDAPTQSLVRVLRADRLQHIAYETKLEAALTECRRQASVIKIKG